jgi:hypothetical protein
MDVERKYLQCNGANTYKDRTGLGKWSCGNGAIERSRPWPDCSCMKLNSLYTDTMYADTIFNNGWRLDSDLIRRSNRNTFKKYLVS